MKRVKIVLVGCGRRSPAWLKTIQCNHELFELVGLCDPIEPRVLERAAAAENKDVKTFTDHKQLLKDLDFAAAAIVTEPEYQAPLSVEFMNAGKDVISEVPVTMSLDECWDLVLTTERTDRVYYLGEQIRHSAMAIQWRELVRSGKLGKILFVEGHYMHGISEDRFWIDPTTGKRLTWKEAATNPNRKKSRFWTMKNPILYAPHELSPLLKVLDDRVRRVSCFSTREVSYRQEEVPFEGKFESVTKPDMQVAMMHSDKDTIIRFAAGFNTPVSECHWYHVMGTKGEVETGRGLDESGKEYYCDFPIDNPTDYRFPRTEKNWTFAEDSPQHRIAAQTGHGGLDFWPIHNFGKVLLGQAEPDIDVYQAVETAAPAIMAVKSLENDGAPQDVPDFRPGGQRRKGEELRD